jgi:hypothetical protein
MKAKRFLAVLAGAVLVILAVFTVGKVSRPVEAQLPGQIELPCPSGLNPLPYVGQLANGSTGKYRQPLCMDPYTGKIFIAADAIYQNQSDPGYTTPTGYNRVPVVAVGTTGSPIAFQTAVFSGSTTVTGIGPGTAGQPFLSNGAGANPSYQALPASSLPATTGNCTGNNFAQGLNAGGTPACSPAVIPLNISTTAVSVTNTTTETTLYTFSVPAGTLSTAGMLRLTLLGQITSSAGPPTTTMRYKYGTGVAATAAETTIASTTNGNVYIQYELAATGATNSQLIEAEGRMVNPANGAQAGTNTWLNANTTAAVDSTAAQAVAVTVQFGALDAGTTLTIRYAILERVN